MTVQVKRNDTKDIISYTLTYPDGSAVNLTGASVRFIMGKGKILLANSIATIINAATGQVSYTLTDEDTIAAGVFQAEFEVTFSDGKRKTFPNNGYIQVTIQANIDKDKSTYMQDQIALRVSDIELFKTEVRADYDAFTMDINSSFSTFKSNVNSNFATLKAEVDTKTTEAETATAAAEVSAANADQVAVFAQAQGDFALEQGNFAKAKGDEAYSKIQAVEVATTEANTATANANEKAVYAQQQGDYAKRVSDENITKWLAPVAKLADIATTYPNPVYGSTVMVTNAGANTGNVYRYEGTWKWTQKYVDTAIADIQAKLNDANKQTQVLLHGLSVINANMDSPVDVEIQGRTLISLGSSVLDAAKNYVLADKKTKIKFADATTHTGLTKFVGKSEKPSMILVANFEGKVSGSTVENPHLMKWSQSLGLINPSGGAETGAGYGLVSTLNASVYNLGATGNGVYSQHLFSFDIIAEIERNIGRIPKATLAEKVKWCKDNVARITNNYHGFGSSVGGYKANLRMWNSSTSTWEETGTVNNTGSISKLIGTSGALSLRVDSNGFVHFLAYAEPSNGTIASNINTDYVELEIELKPEAILHDPIVPLYEVDTTEYANILVSWNEATVLNKYPRVQGVQHLQNPFVMAEGENLLPPFSEWVLHPNAKEISPYELELNASSPWQWSSVVLNVISGQDYYFITESTGYLDVLDADTNTNIVALAGNASRKISVPANTKRMKIQWASVSTGTYVFKNPMLTLGTVVKPFTPRNPSYLLAQTKIGQIGSMKDTLYKQDGQWFKRKVVEKDVVLDGSYAWYLSYNGTGVKRFSFTGLNNVRNESETSIKYNGRRLAHTEGGASSWLADSSRLTDVSFGEKTMMVSASNVDTGFGETYIPLTDEIKAYFNGWQAKTVDGTGKPTAWRSLGDGTDAPTQTLAYVSANRAPNYTPYKLSYLLATPQIVPVNVEGEIAVNGLTQVEVGSGVVVREKVIPVSDPGAGVYRINSTRIANSNLKNMASLILNIYKNGVIDKVWSSRTSDALAFGKADSVALLKDIEATSEYTVTYLVHDRHLFTNNAQEVKATYDSSLKGVVDTLTERQADLAAQGSVNVQAIAELYKRVRGLGG
jgi:hypothetical protein